MSQYSMERSCPKDSKKYMLIPVSGLWAEKFAIKIDVMILKYWKIVIFEISIIFYKIDWFQSRIVQLTFLPPKWACTF